MKRDILKIKKIRGNISQTLIVLSIGMMIFSSTLFGNEIFSDIPSGVWYEENVIQLVNDKNQIIKGYPDGTFRPGVSIEVDQFITMVVKANGYTIDIGKDYWAQPFIDQAISLGLIVDGEFDNYSRPITRQEMTPIIIRSIEHIYPGQNFALESSVEDMFKDGGNIPQKYAIDVMKCVEIGIIKGYEDATFRGSALLTRAQASAVLIRILYPEERMFMDTLKGSVLQVGAVADANYYNSSTGLYYRDADFKYQATDNRKAFQAAFNSWKDVTIPKGNYYVSDMVHIYKGIQVSAHGAVVYTKSSTDLKYLFRIAASNTKITGMTVKTTLDQKPRLNNSEQSGRGSNVYAFVIQASNVTIDQCETYNVCRGVHANKTSEDIKNITITNCKFNDATIPIFMMYTDGIIIDKCYLESNDSGLPNGFHSLYFGTNTYNATITNTDMNFKSINNGAIVQFFSNKFDKVNIRNIKVSNCNFETKGNHLVVLGEVENIVFDNITFLKNNPTSGRKSQSGKLIYAHEYVYDISIQNSTFIMDDAANIINGIGTNSGSITLKNNSITTTLEPRTNLFTTVMDMTIEDNDIILSKDSGGLFFGFGGGGSIDFSNNSVYSDAQFILLGSGSSSSKGSLKMTNNIFDLNNGKSGFAFYNNTGNMKIEARNNSLLDFTKLAENDINIIDINNLYRK